jgi:hypothetical protein
MELRNQLPSSHPLTAPVHPPERVTGPPELHHSEGRYPHRPRIGRQLLIGSDQRDRDAEAAFNANRHQAGLGAARLATLNIGVSSSMRIRNLGGTQLIKVIGHLAVAGQPCRSQTVPLLLPH